MHSLHRLLVDYDMAMLRALAENRGLALDTNRQSEAVDRLATGLLEPVSLRTALARLSPQAREALDTLLARRGPDAVSRSLPGSSARCAPSALDGWSERLPGRTPDNPAEELWYAGLIFHTFFQDKGGPGDFIVIPQELQPLLPQSARRTGSLCRRNGSCPPSTLRAMSSFWSTICSFTSSTFRTTTRAPMPTVAWASATWEPSVSVWSTGTRGAWPCCDTWPAGWVS